jgi:hypothetical protein
MKAGNRGFDQNVPDEINKKSFITSATLIFRIWNINVATFFPKEYNKTLFCYENTDGRSAEKNKERIESSKVLQEVWMKTRN